MQKQLQFTELCDRYGIAYRTSGNHTRRGWVQIDCPFCGPGTDKFHMGFCLSFPRFSCWRCGKHRTKETLKLLTGEIDKNIDGLMNALPRETLPAEDIIKGTLLLPSGVKPLKKAHKLFLRERRFNPDRIEKVWGVGGMGMDGGYKKDGRWVSLAWRLFIPIELNTVVSSWTTRTISKDPEVTRYISADRSQERISHKELLYGEDFAGNTIIIVEGPTDAWRIGPGAVATFGTRPTAAQILRMGRYAKRYVLFDAGAERHAQSLVGQLSAFAGETYNVSIDADDPDSMSRKELQLVRGLLQ